MYQKIKKIVIWGDDFEAIELALYLLNTDLDVVILTDFPKKAEGIKDQFITAPPAPVMISPQRNPLKICHLADKMEHLSSSQWIIEFLPERSSQKISALEAIDQYRHSNTLVSSFFRFSGISGYTKDKSRSFLQHYSGISFLSPLRQKRIMEVVVTSQSLEPALDQLVRFLFVVAGRQIYLNTHSDISMVFHLALEWQLKLLDLSLKYRIMPNHMDFILQRSLKIFDQGIFKQIDYYQPLACAETLKQFKGDTHLKQLGLQFLDLSRTDFNRFYQTVKQPSGKTVKQVWNPWKKTYDKPTKMKFRSVRKAPGKTGVEKRLNVYLNLKDAAALMVQDFHHEFQRNYLDYLHKNSMPKETLDLIMSGSLGLQKEYLDLISENLTQTDLSTSARKLEITPPYLAGMPAPVNRIVLQKKLDQPQKLWQNPGSSIYLTADQILICQFHTRNNIMDETVIEGLGKAYELLEQMYDGLIIGGNQPHFTVGANLGLVFMASIEKNFKKLDFMVDAFQKMVLQARHVKKPVMVALWGMCLGGGCELTLHVDGIQAAPETKIGLVEAKAGIIPAGGGTKEMTRRMATWNNYEKCVEIFRNLATGRLSDSAFEAIEMNILGDQRQITMQPDLVMADALLSMRQLIRGDFKPKPEDSIRIYPELKDLFALEIEKLQEKEELTPFEATVAEKIAYIMTGGSETGEIVASSYLLELEKEAFLSLCGNWRTLERLKAIISGKTIPKN